MVIGRGDRTRNLTHISHHCDHDHSSYITARLGRPGLHALAALALYGDWLVQVLQHNHVNGAQQWLYCSLLSTLSTSALIYAPRSPVNYANPSRIHQSSVIIISIIISMSFFPRCLLVPILYFPPLFFLHYRNYVLLVMVLYISRKQILYSTERSPALPSFAVYCTARSS